MNMAALWKLPVVYLCENNLYTEYTHYTETTAGEILARAVAFGIPAEDVDGQDVLAVHDAACRAVTRARAGEGATFLCANTYRFHGHHVGDVDRSYYRSKDEEADWRTNRDPITRLGAQLVDAGLATPEELERVAKEAQDEIAAGVRFALDAPFPAGSEVTEHVYA
jgi:pyruvate dehydrogenase E1 component alpha subunit